MRRRKHTMRICVGVIVRVPRTRHCTQNQHHLPRTNIPAIRISVSHRLNVSSVHNDGFGNWPPRNDRASSARYLRDHILCCPCSYSSRLSRSLEQFNRFTSWLISTLYPGDIGMIASWYLRYTQALTLENGEELDLSDCLCLCLSAVPRNLFESSPGYGGASVCACISAGAIVEFWWIGSIALLATYIFISSSCTLCCFGASGLLVVVSSFATGACSSECRCCNRQAMKWRDSRSGCCDVCTLEEESTGTAAKMCERRKRVKAGWDYFGALPRIVRKCLIGFDGQTGMCTKCLGTRLETLELEHCFPFNTVFVKTAWMERCWSGGPWEDSTMDDGCKWEFGCMQRTQCEVAFCKYYHK
jgi:hypothetical protein